MQSLAPAPTSADTMRAPSQDVVSEQLLREQLLSQVATTHSARDPNEMPTSSPASPNEPSAVDQTMSGSGMMSASAGSDDGNDHDGRKSYGKRELSTSKRAAQNRAAQRAFRQRKEGYIKKLEEQVRDYTVLNEQYKAAQGENFQLRDYIINLQSRLIESQGDFPQPPPNIDGLHPGNAAHHSQMSSRHMGPGPPSDMSGLDQVRGAVSAGRASEFNGQAPEGAPYHTSDASALTRMKTEEEMNVAQQTLQGRPDR